MIRLLFLASNPNEEVMLRIDREMDAIDRHLRLAGVGHRFVIEQKWAVRVDEVQTHLHTFHPDIVHFAGHGADGDLLLEDVNGNAKLLSAQTFADMLGLCDPPLRCVVLNACNSQEQADVFAAHIACVIAMPDLLSDRAAKAFAQSFYQALGTGAPLGQAFRAGQLQIKTALGDDKAQPQIYVRNEAVLAQKLILEASTANEEIFTNIWYAPKRYRFWEFRHPDIGTLVVQPDRVLYQGERFNLEISEIQETRHIRQGGSVNNNWVRVTYSNDQTLQTAYFAQASRLGIGELIGGSHKLMESLHGLHKRLNGRANRQHY